MVVHGRLLIAAMAVRGELAGRREMEGLGLGSVEESVGCAPWRESNQDGLGEEIDGMALFSVKNRAMTKLERGKR